MHIKIEKYNNNLSKNKHAYAGIFLDQNVVC